MRIFNYAPDESRREWRFLIQCVASQLSGWGDAAPMLDAQGLNWSTILRLAEANRVVPLLAAAVLAKRVTNVAPDVVAELVGRYRYYAQRGLFFAVELRTLLGALRQQKIRCISLKGPALTIGSYRKLGLRDFDDLDLLVAPSDVPRAVCVLSELGLAGWDIPDWRIASHLNTECEHNLVRTEPALNVDLHWSIGRKYFTMPMDFEALWERTERVKLIGGDVPNLCAEDNLLFLCYHGGKHLFGRLTWICDIGATIAAYPELDWDALLATAAEMGASRLLLLGLCLAEWVLGSKIPARLQELIRSDSTLRSLATIVVRGIFAEAESTSVLKERIQESLFHLRVRERMSDRLRYLVWAAAPNARDWGDSRLPRSLGFLLVLSRPIRLLRKTA